MTHTAATRDLLRSSVHASARALAVFALLFAASACRTSATEVKAEPAAPSSTSISTTRGAAAVRRVVGTQPGGVGAGTPLKAEPGHELAAFSAGCFWGVEDNFRQVPGVLATAVGYTGGHTTNPTYTTVCTHTTGHAETVLVEFDPAKVSYDELLRLFFLNHDPTTRNRQGPDIGDQYRSAVFTFSGVQDAAAQKASAAAAARLGKPVTTEIARLGQFWKAEEYHQQYDEKSGTHSCPLPRGLTGNGT